MDTGLFQKSCGSRIQRPSITTAEEYDHSPSSTQHFQVILIRQVCLSQKKTTINKQEVPNRQDGAACCTEGVRNTLNTVRKILHFRALKTPQARSQVDMTPRSNAGTERAHLPCHSVKRVAKLRCVLLA